MRLCVVIPIFNEADNLDALHRRLSAVFQRLPWRSDACEVLYVDDGSTDRSLDIMRAQVLRDPGVRIVALSRNFGHQAAIMAGLAAADADAVVLMDGDLQDPPELIPDMVARWDGAGGEAQVVRATRRSRQDAGVRGVGFRAFHRLHWWVGDIPEAADVGVYCLLGRRAADELTRLPEKNRFLPGLRSWIGFSQTTVEYDRQARASGAPKQSLVRLVRYAADAIFSFSYKPLRIMVAVGTLVSGVGFGLASVYVAKRLLGIETAQTGFTTLVTLVLFLGGLQLMALGLVGEYLGRVYDEVKHRPLYIVKDTFRAGPPVSPSDPAEDQV